MATIRSVADLVGSDVARMTPKLALGAAVVRQAEVSAAIHRAQSGAMSAALRHAEMSAAVSQLAQGGAAAAALRHAEIGAACQRAWGGEAARSIARHLDQMAGFYRYHRQIQAQYEAYRDLARHISRAIARAKRDRDEARKRELREDQRFVRTNLERLAKHILRLRAPPNLCRMQRFRLYATVLSEVLRTSHFHENSSEVEFATWLSWRATRRKNKKLDQGGINETSSRKDDCSGGHEVRRDSRGFPSRALSTPPTDCRLVVAGRRCGGVSL